MDVNQRKRKAYKEINSFIKECEYTYIVSDILKSYLKYWAKGKYTSYTMTICIKNHEDNIKILLGMR
jgi:hypothetical protein